MKRNCYKTVSNNRIMLYLIVILILVISNVITGAKLIKSEVKLNNLNKKVSEMKHDGDITRITLDKCETANNFLNDFVAIIPENKKYYLNYSKWEGTKYYNEPFMIMSVKDAEKKGYSDKYVRKPGVVSVEQHLEERKELY